MKDHDFGEQILKEAAPNGDAQKKERVIDMARSAWGDMPVKADLPDVHEKLHQQKAEKVEATGQPAERPNLAEASHRIKLLNNELHKPGGALASSALELVGFDKNGRLLLVQRDQSGKVDGKYLVDSESGKIVARTEPGQLNNWERGAGYDLKATKISPEPAYDAKSGATIAKDNHGHVSQVTDFHGDQRSYVRDQKGQLAEIIISEKGLPPVHYKPGEIVAGVSSHLWYKQPHLERDPGFRFEVKDDGALIQYTNSTESKVFNINGSILERHAKKRDVVRRAGYDKRQPEIIIT